MIQIILQTVIASLAIISLLLVHELGHYFAAKAAGLTAYEFSIGIGPKLLQHKGKKNPKTGKSTIWSIRAFPLGGYCSFDDPNEVKEANISYDPSVDRLPMLKRILVYLAGPGANILLAFLISFSVYAISGNAHITNEIDGFLDKSPAKEAGFQEHDIIEQVNGIDWSRAVMKEAVDSGKEITFTINRNGEFIDYKVTPYWNDKEDRYLIGINQHLEKDYFDIKGSFVKAGQDLIDNVVGVYKGFYGLTKRTYGVTDMSSAVGVVNIMKDYATPTGAVIFAMLLSMISVNLGIFNLLPIPALDGAHIVTAVVETILKRKINRRAGHIVSFACLCLLMGLSFILIFVDIYKIVQ